MASQEAPLPSEPSAQKADQKPAEEPEDTDTDSEHEGSAKDLAAKKHRNKMRSKLNRLCDRTATGRLQVSEEIHNMWLKKGKIRDDMVNLMVAADGNRAP